MARIGVSYGSPRAPIKPEKSLEDFLINRFGRELYLTFFKSYTEKVWGTPCDQISAEWGAQRIKGLSPDDGGEALRQEDLLRQPAANERDIAQKGTETSLIERFHVSEVRPGAALGARRRQGRSRRRRDSHGLAR